MSVSDNKNNQPDQQEQSPSPSFYEWLSTINDHRSEREKLVEEYMNINKHDDMRIRYIVKEKADFEKWNRL